MKIEKMEKGPIWGCGQCFNEGRNADNADTIYRILFDDSGTYQLQLCGMHLKELAEKIMTELIYKEN